MSVTKPVLAFTAALASVAFGIFAVPMTVSALTPPLSITCTGALVAYDTGYGIGQLAASPACTVTVLVHNRLPS